MSQIKPTNLRNTYKVNALFNLSSTSFLSVYISVDDSPHFIVLEIYQRSPLFKKVN